MWKEKLDKLAVKKSRYNEKFNKGVSENDINKFKCDVKKTLKTNLPIEYINFLKQVNGLEFNGMIIYGVDKYIYSKEECQFINGFIENNQLWQKNDYLKEYIFFGENDISWYAYNINSRCLELLDKPSGDIIERFNNFLDMLENMLNSCQ